MNENIISTISEEEIVLAQDLPTTYSATSDTNDTVYSGVYKLKNKCGCLCVTVETDSFTSAEVMIDNDKNDRNQWFKITHLGGGQYSIRPLHKTDMALTVYQVQKETYMVMATGVGRCDTLDSLDAASRWMIDASGAIRNALYDCIVMATATTDACDYGNVFATVDTGAAHQRWNLIPVNNVTTNVLIYDNPKVVYIGETVSAGVTEVSSALSISQGVTWSSSIPSVAKVNRTGTITPIAVGKTIITATSLADTNASASYMLTVVEKDSDYDGTADTEDDSPNNNAFQETWRANYTSDGIYIQTEVDYKLDYRDFFGNNTIYNPNICKTSILMAALMYERSSLDMRGIEPFLTNHGMLDIEDEEIVNTGDDHETQVALGFRPVHYNGMNKLIIAVVIRGTNETLAEWSSNIDIGKTGDTSFEHDDWKNENNHMGFDIAANRVLEKVKLYVAKIRTDYPQFAQYVETYWVTGHSRAAAIANIVAASLVDETKIVYAYTFAAPATTVSASATDEKYNCIFNILNSDDFIPYFPLSSWGFKRYGKTARLSIEDTCKNEWQTQLGITKYKKMSEPEAPFNELYRVANTRNKCYEYGDHVGCIANDDSYPTNTTGYYEVDSSTVRQMPMFVMKYFSAMAAITPASEHRSGLDFLFLNVAPYLEDAKWSVISQVTGITVATLIHIKMFGFTGVATAYMQTDLDNQERMAFPHMPESYMLLSTKITSNMFNN